MHLIRPFLGNKKNLWYLASVCEQESLLQWKQSREKYPRHEEENTRQNSVGPCAKGRTTEDPKTTTCLLFLF